MQGDQLVARECYLAMLAMDEHVQMMNIEERKVTTEPIKILEDVPLDESNPKRFTKIGTSMEEKRSKTSSSF